MRPTWAVIDLEAIAANVVRFADLVGDAELCAVVKADGYGHGAVPVARTALRAGATWLAVALVEEAAELRREGVEAPILLLSEPRPAEMAEVAGLGGVRPTVYTPDGVEAFAATAAPGSPVHLKVDTGMHRVGVAPHGAVDLAGRVIGAGLALEGVFTHFALADRTDEPITGLQVERFDAVLAELADAGFDPPLTHQANTAGVLNRPDSHRSMVRIGVGIYGVEPSPLLRSRCRELGLQPAVLLRSEVSHLQVVGPGEGVGYSHRWTTPAVTHLAIVPIGYADGIFRGWWEGGEVLIGGRRRPIRGLVTMDSLIVEVDEAVAVGDEVVLLGAQGDECLRAGEVGELLGTIGYEVLTSLGARVPRRY